MEDLLVSVYVEGFEWEHVMIKEAKIDSVIVCDEKGQELDIDWDAIIDMSWG